MGWFSGNSSANQNHKNDPTQQLEPGLREYLDKEAPAKYKPTESTSPPPPRESYRDQVNNSAPSKPEQQDDASQTDKPTVPAASLFPDGRYAYLWKNYRPLQEEEESVMSPAEKVVNHFKKRSAMIQDAALENCAEEHETLTNCFKLGDFSNRVRARMTMCNFENKKFSRCYTMQGKFLGALGYGDDFQDQEKQERIQMHADKLYHEMLDFEAKVAEAKAAGAEPPPARSLFKPEHTPDPASGKQKQFDGVTDDQPITPQVQKVLKDMTPHERELELQIIKQQNALQARYSGEIAPMLNAQAEAGKQRQEKLSKYVGETVARWITP